MVAGNQTFLGINEVEAQDRTNEEHTGVPAQGESALLLSAPVRLTEAVHVVNKGGARVDARLKHQGQTKTVAAELLAALAATATNYVGKLEFGSITPKSVAIVNAGAPATIVDDGLGDLVDTGTTTKRGTINYATGLIDFTYGAAPTEPVTIAYTHTDYTEFASPGQSTSFTPGGGEGTGGTPANLQLSFGRVVPGSIAFTDGGGDTFVDDGKGSIIETTVNAVKVGTVDYGTGLIIVTDAVTALTGTFSVTFTFNPFASLVAAGAAAKLLNAFGNSVPELTAEPWADGIKGESRIGLWGEAVEADPDGSALITQWVHFGEEPYRVESAFSGFPPGGAVAIAGNRNG